MTIIKIAPHDNGGHDNQTSSSIIPIPEGWAIIPEEVGTPETLGNFPFGEVTVEIFEDVPTVTSWTPLPLPEPIPAPPAGVDPTTEDIVKAILGG